MGKEKMSFNSWRRIKRNGNTAQKRRDLIKKILYPNLNEIRNGIQIQATQNQGLNTVNDSQITNDAEIPFRENNDPM